MNSSILTDLLNGNATADQYAGLAILFGVLVLAVIFNLRDQREESRGRK